MGPPRPRLETLLLAAAILVGWSRSVSLSNQLGLLKMVLEAPESRQTVSAESLLPTVMEVIYLFIHCFGLGHAGPSTTMYKGNRIM